MRIIFFFHLINIFATLKDKRFIILGIISTLEMVKIIWPTRPRMETWIISKKFQVMCLQVKKIEHTYRKYLQIIVSNGSYWCHKPNIGGKLIYWRTSRDNQPYNWTTRRDKFVLSDADEALIIVRTLVNISSFS